MHASIRLILVYCSIVVVLVALYYRALYRGTDGFQDAIEKPSEMDARLRTGAPRIACVTAIFGGYDPLKTPAIENMQDVDWFCFTDDTTMTNPVWKVVTTPYHIQNAKPENKQYKNDITNLTDPMIKNMMSAKYYKINTHEIDILQGYDYYIWIDGSIILRPNFLKNMLEFANKGCSLVNFKHSERDTIKDELKLSITMKKYKSQNLQAQYDAYMNEGFPDTQGLFECTINMKKNSVHINSLFDLWWIENLKHSYQDQLSYVYALWKKGITPDCVINEKVFWNEEYSYTTTQMMKKHLENA
jgi:hypothetical protein